MARKPARYWLGTCFCENHPEELTGDLVWVKGQREVCPSTGRQHWQLIVGFAKPQRLSGVKRIVCSCHWEPTKSEASERYVWKEETRVAGSQFELGGKPLRRNSAADWDEVRRAAERGQFGDIPSDIYIRLMRY